jgi:hypothetical protein
VKLLARDGGPRKLFVPSSYVLVLILAVAFGSLGLPLLYKNIYLKTSAGLSLTVMFKCFLNVFLILFIFF